MAVGAPYNYSYQSAAAVVIRHAADIPWCPMETSRDSVLNLESVEAA